VAEEEGVVLEPVVATVAVTVAVMLGVTVVATVMAMLVVTVLVMAAVMAAAMVTVLLSAKATTMAMVGEATWSAPVVGQRSRHLVANIGPAPRRDASPLRRLGRLIRAAE